MNSTAKAHQTNKRDSTNHKTLFPFCTARRLAEDEFSCNRRNEYNRNKRARSHRNCSSHQPCHRNCLTNRWLYSYHKWPSSRPWEGDRSKSQRRWQGDRSTSQRRWQGETIQRRWQGETSQRSPQRGSTSQRRSQRCFGR